MKQTIHQRLDSLSNILPQSFFVSYALACARAVLPLNKNFEVISKNLDIVEGFMKGTNSKSELETARNAIWKERNAANAAAYAAAAAAAAYAAAANATAAYAADAYAANAAAANAANAAKRSKKIKFDADKLLDSMLANISKFEKEYYQIKEIV